MKKKKGLLLLIVIVIFLSLVVGVLAEGKQYFWFKWDQPGYAVAFSKEGYLLGTYNIVPDENNFGVSIPFWKKGEIAYVKVYFSDQTYAGSVQESGQWPK